MKHVKRTPPRSSRRSCKCNETFCGLPRKGVLSFVAEPALVEKIGGLARGVFIQAGVAVEGYRGRNMSTSVAMVLVMFPVGRSGYLQLRQQS